MEQERARRGVSLRSLPRIRPMDSAGQEGARQQVLKAAGEECADTAEGFTMGNNVQAIRFTRQGTTLLAVSGRRRLPTWEELEEFRLHLIPEDRRTVVTIPSRKGTPPQAVTITMIAEPVT